MEGAAKLHGEGTGEDRRAPLGGDIIVSTTLGGCSEAVQLKHEKHDAEDTSRKSDPGSTA
jgi:hypothetical protein